MTDRFAILLAGSIDPTPALRAAVAGCRSIAADRGMAHAEPLNLVPELWIGDFDSAPPDLLERHADVSRETFPAAKDRTDGELAIEAAIRRGARRLLLVGALGGPRTDHAFAHLVLALRYAAAGFEIELFDGRERAVPLLPGENRIAAEPGAAFSILKFDDLEGLSIDGARWPLRDVDLPFDSILTQSNEAAGDEIVVRLRAGRAVLLVQTAPERI
ncbi:thiamine diphosphokinase [Aureimonas leprariae]|uniref:Thiamine diphosphokinase n=1 Tax=Plantimonas leprariae TaxID=2615207 RepID=A0A7V7PNM0_9HYPH|nr:thiamine diphosphokinase [Aureimonas leprariae]KAB0679233.1 thiamine diphosphokinase [Aureimonas leprariae]